LQLFLKSFINFSKVTRKSLDSDKTASEAATHFKYYEFEEIHSEFDEAENFSGSVEDHLDNISSDEVESSRYRYANVEYADEHEPVGSHTVEENETVKTEDEGTATGNITILSLVYLF
jgi:hypothetical protein